MPKILGRPSSPARRRENLRASFGAGVGQEQARFTSTPRRRLLGELRERFLREHLPRRPGLTLELGPGPGRFSAAVLEGTRGPYLAVDLSRPALRQARRQLRRRGLAARGGWVEGAGEHLPLRDGAANVVVLLGNLTGFAAGDREEFLREVARVLRRGGTLIADFPTRGGSIQEFLYAAARGTALPRVLAQPDRFLIPQVLETGTQHRDLARLSRWDFHHYTAREARELLERTGFRLRELRSVAPLSAYQDGVAEIAIRDPRQWAHLLEIEERVGRDSEFHGTGHGLLACALRT